MPTAAYREWVADKGDLAAQIEAWRTTLHQSWDQVRLVDVRLD